MSTTSSAPQHRPPLPTKCPALGSVKVTVFAAFTAVPSTRPVSASTPLAMSTDTTGTPQVFIICTAVTASPRRSVFRPMPKRASTITSASRLQAANWGSESVKSSSFPPDCSSRRSISRQSALIFSRLPTRTQRTSQPISSRKRAAATPSPPLLPGPQNSTARPSVLPPARSLTARATAQAAASISCTEGIPRSSMAVRSISRICAAVAIFIADHAPLSLFPGPQALIGLYYMAPRTFRQSSRRFFAHSPQMAQIHLAIFPLLWYIWR